jgi:hypothetical protein
MLLSACATDSVATFRAADGRLAVALSSICEAFLQPVPPPAVTRKTDGRIAFTKTANALDEANGRLVSGGDCVRDQRAAFARGGKNR